MISCRFQITVAHSKHTTLMPKKNTSSYFQNIIFLNSTEILLHLKSGIEIGIHTKINSKIVEWLEYEN